jgi:multiple sugar transport system permease protein
MTVAEAPVVECQKPRAPAPPLKKSAGRGLPRGERLMAHAGLLLVSAAFLLPFVWMLSTSVKPLEQTTEYPPRFIPETFQPQNYLDVITHEKMHFLLFARNTLIIAVLAVIGTTLSSALVAYGFARIRFKGRGILFALMLSTMMIPFPVMMVSLFVIFRWLGDCGMGQWLGTYRPLWVPAWFGSAFSIFLLRQFFMTIPDELSEAARIDGCSELGIFFRIILPLSRPALAVVALFTFMWAWNDFLGPLVYIQDQGQYTLSLGLQTFQSAHGGTEFHYLMAAAVMVLAPVMVLFFLAQKTFIQGIATTGVKG